MNVAKLLIGLGFLGAAFVCFLNVADHPGLAGFGLAFAMVSYYYAWRSQRD